jgi:hypothetical protein
MITRCQYIFQGHSNDERRFPSEEQKLQGWNELGRMRAVEKLWTNAF